MKAIQYHFENISGERVTIIDTPGFGDELDKEEKTIDDLVDVLKNEVKYDIHQLVNFLIQMNIHSFIVNL